MADIRLPSVICDGMVIQQGMDVPVWGWTNAGQRVQVESDWSCSFATVASGTDGKWVVKLAAPPVGGPYQLKIKTNDATVVLKDILCGEVWLACGQSNMEMPLGTIMGDNYHGVHNYWKEIADANYPAIRFFTPFYKKKHMPQTEFDGRWVSCDPESAKFFPAVAYFFGQYLHKQLDIPIGLINSSFGGSKIEYWIPQEAFRADILESHLDRPRSIFFDEMIKPLVPYGIRGVIWYQGEENVTNALQYSELFSTLIHSWRRIWSQGDFPFYFVQIAPCGGNRYPPLTAAQLRQAQLNTFLTVPNTGIVVTTDTVDDPYGPSPDDVHPRNKQDVGKRLALWALAKTYGHDVVYSGPLYRSLEIEGDKIRLYFEHTDGGLRAARTGLNGFGIAGTNKRFVEASAVIDGNTVVVWSENVSEPVSVRFGWDNALGRVSPTVPAYLLPLSVQTNCRIRAWNKTMIRAVNRFGKYRIQ